VYLSSEWQAVKQGVGCQARDETKTRTSHVGIDIYLREIHDMFMREKIMWFNFLWMLKLVKQWGYQQL